MRFNTMAEFVAFLDAKLAIDREAVTTELTWPEWNAMYPWREAIITNTEVAPLTRLSDIRSRIQHAVKLMGPDFITDCEMFVRDNADLQPEA